MTAATPAPTLRDRIVDFRRVPSSELERNPRNWRRHPPEQRAALDEVLEKIGIAGAVLAYKSERTGKLTLIDGELRSESQAEWPTLILDVDDAEADHLLATFDPTTLLSTPDPVALSALLADVSVDTDAMLRLLKGMSGTTVAAGETDPDDTPAPASTPASQLGELWILGEHRLLVGDATKPASWKRLIDAGGPAVVFTDPPYGINWEFVRPSGETLNIAGGDMRDLELQQLLTKVFRIAARNTAPDTAFYVWHAERCRDLFVAALSAAGLFALDTVLWIKPASPRLQRSGHYRRTHEPCLYACRSGQTPRWFGGDAEQTVWRLTAADTPADVGVDLGDGILVTDGAVGLWIAPRGPKQRRHRRHQLGERGLTLNVGDEATSTTWEVSRDERAQHPTQKPVALARRALLNSSEAGDLVIDPFAGSGSTLIAAEQTGRRARCLEVDPRYADVILRRWSLFTGRDPVREDGVSWSSVVLDMAVA